MLRSTWLFVALFILSVLPTTLAALIFAMVGLPFWLVGMGDFILGNIGFIMAKLKLLLLFVTAPLGLVGIHCLWRVFWLRLHRRVIDRPERLALGLIGGVLAGIHLLFFKIALLAIALPATIYALLHLRAATQRPQCF